jgi:hypothetical protein
MKFNQKNFDIREVIQKRVNLEAEFDHANDPKPEIPKYEIKREKIKLNVGVINFCKQLLV